MCRERFPSLAHSLDRLRSSLLEKTDEIEPLKAWEFQELGLQAAQRVAQIQGEEALQILQFTAQNFPTQAKSLLHQRVPEDFKKEMKHNIDILGKHLNIQPPDAALFVNGLFFDAETLDVGSLLETLRSELRVLDGLHKLSECCFSLSKCIKNLIDIIHDRCFRCRGFRCIRSASTRLVCIWI